MEINEISMFMDVKLDINDKRPEAIKFKTWTKCLVKIEAVKCLPCFLRITFVRNVENEAANLSVSINIPGVKISLATSRTKQYSYGIFWVHNRKRCVIYFALDTDEACKRHMKWMKKSINSMELHRQLFLESRRSSRGRLDNNVAASVLRHDSIDEEGDEHEFNVNWNPQDILGPLPKIPDMDSINWSRRVSGMSGIYEEIPDSEPRISRRLSRVSIASGIYEEMKPVERDLKDLNKEANEPGPPLPPRKRVNTYKPDENLFIPRSNTNPESDLAKKKKYKNVLDNIFGRSKRSESVSEGKVCSPEDLVSTNNCSTPEDEKSELYVNTPARTRNRNRGFGSCEARITNNKRNSFSSPDLSKINVFDQFESLDDLSSLSSDLQDCDLSSDTFTDTPKTSKVNISKIAKIPEDLNISENIQPNFNFSCNSSTINLVGANVYTQNVPPLPPQVLIDDMSGYCVMAPIKRYNNDSDKENDEKNEAVPLLKEKAVLDDSAIYEQMTENCEKNEKQVIYENLNEFGKPNVFLIASGGGCVSNKKEPVEDYYKTPRKIITSVDDKIPSYYPNSCDTAKVRRRGASPPNPAVRNLANLRVPRRENLYISSPQKIIDQRRKPENSQEAAKKSSPLLARKISDNVYAVTRLTDEDDDAKNAKIVEISIENAKKSKSLATLQNIDFKFDDTKNEQDVVVSTNSARIYQKYATITRISPTKYLDKCAAAKRTNSGDMNAVRKFASLPRFKKIDFSPLRMKINNVLQRHHTEGV